MRITGGRARGIPLQSPSNDKTRPATDYLREALFSSLGPLVEDSTVLDLFAGTGSYGLEALSRQARHVTFVEKNRQVIRHLNENVAKVAKSLSLENSQKHVQIFTTDALKWKPDTNTRYDIILADPPYPLLEKQAPNILERTLPLLSDSIHARFILEAPGGFEIDSTPCDFTLCKRIEKGKNQPSALIFKRADSP